MRSTRRQPRRRASAQFTRNVHAFPRCSGPVGLGAMREQGTVVAIARIGIVRPTMARLTAKQIAEKLALRPEWTKSGGVIQRTFAFPDFVHAMRFVDRVAAEAERVQHHPDILVRWNKVSLTLSTHDAGGITDKDFAFAAEADRMAAVHAPPAPPAAPAA